MASISLFEERVRFGADLPQEVDACLQQAAAATDDGQRAHYLEQAQRLGPEQLEVYIARYKFFCYRGRLAEAESLACEALLQASRQGGFDADWQTLEPPTKDWTASDKPGRLYLYSLKALAFICLRQEDTKQARLILQHLRRLDPTDQVGGSVIAELAGAFDD